MFYCYCMVITYLLTYFLISIADNADQCIPVLVVDCIRCVLCDVSVKIIATRSGDVDMVSLLVGAAGSDVNKASYVARSRAIHWAASSSDCDGSVDCLRVLLGRGADVEARVASGRTPLLLAARAGHLQAVEQLLRHGIAASCHYVPQTS